MALISVPSSACGAGGPEAAGNVDLLLGHRKRAALEEIELIDDPVGNLGL